MARIGVFVCHCGTNIAATVDVEKVAQLAADLPGVAFATDYRYMCSDPGQKLIAEAISELDDGTRSFIIITHYPRILKYVKPDAVHVMVGGRIVKSGDESLAHEIEEQGYSSYMKG